METNMSAYIVGHDHIDALLTFATADDPQAFGPISYRLEPSGNRVEITATNATDVGRILLTENERSVEHRSRATTICPARSARKRLATRSARSENPSAGRDLKACDCFEYQACETDDYRSRTPTGSLTRSSRPISRLPG